MGIEQEKSIAAADEEYQATRIDTDILVNELWERGITIRDIFGKYYEREEAGHAHSLTVEDARLAGMGGQ